jgi:hypothetical protein
MHIKEVGFSGVRRGFNLEDVVSAVKNVKPQRARCFWMDHQVIMSWLRHCAASRKFAGSIPDGVIGIFH